MTYATHRHTAALSSLLIAVSFWLPTAASLSDASSSASRIASPHQAVSAASSRIVLM